MRRYIYALTLLLPLFLLSCEKEPELLDSLSGFIYIEAPQFVMPGDEIEMTTGGLGADVEIKYSWTGDLISNSSLKTDTLSDVTKVRLTVGDILGQQSLIVYAEAEGYYKRQMLKMVTVLSREADKSLTGTDFSGCGQMTDSRDGRKYYYTQVGDLDWFCQNLAWDGKGTPYGRMSALREIFGSLYTWNEATGGESRSGLGNGPRGVCPEGWTVPTNEDWENLASCLAGKPVGFEGTWPGLGEKVTVEAYLNDMKVWPYSLHHQSENQFKWNALATGYGNLMSDYFDTLMERGMWWSSTERNGNIAMYRYIYYDESSFPYAGTNKDDMMVAVRCVRKIN